jgi:hypothetical protein
VLDQLVHLGDWLPKLGEWLPYLKTILLVFVVMVGLIAAAAGMYVIRAVAAPLLQVAQWMVAYTPGERPNDVVAGLIFGLRMLA